MISFPHAKINLGLHILEKRADGYHNLETCFYPVFSLCDALEMTESSGDSNLTISGMEWKEPKEKNLIWKAYQLFKKHEPNLPEMDWHLLKKIPTGGGLGGGSSDAAFALPMLAEKSGWSKDDPRLFEMAASLGSDCAFFLHDAPMIGTGRGEILEPIALDLTAFQFQFVFPGIHISTAMAFSNVTPRVPRKSIREILGQPISTWKAELKNDFEESVFSQFPKLKNLKEKLYADGAIYAAMSGSGSTLFGIFE